MHVGTSGNTGRNVTLLSAAPVPSSGWVLIGDLNKFIPCWPQRFVVLVRDSIIAGAPRNQDLVDGDVELQFRVQVIGSR